MFAFSSTFLPFPSPTPTPPPQSPWLSFLPSPHGSDLLFLNIGRAWRRTRAWGLRRGWRRPELEARKARADCWADELPCAAPRPLWHSSSPPPTALSPPSCDVCSGGHRARLDGDGADRRATRSLPFRHRATKLLLPLGSLFPETRIGKYRCGAYPAPATRIWWAARSRSAVP